ncbi:DUF397 domain-containing protein [Micromonospora sp. NPDC049523]|uniref:DUF397 domain-containing protein n=1 Tax=Micromonospora sp. NPDC049523 TaxID=3155921 RepID=UPI003431D7B8
MSTRSDSNQGTCVEVADNLPGRVLVRDTKDRTAGTLTFTPATWRAFASDLRHPLTRPAPHC